MKRINRYVNMRNCRRAEIGISILFAACLLIFGKIQAGAAPAVLLPPALAVEMNESIPDDNAPAKPPGAVDPANPDVPGEADNAPAGGGGIGNTNTGADDDEPENEETEEETGTEETPSISDNTRDKTYAIQGDADRIRVQTPEEQAPQEPLLQEAGPGIDKALFLLIGTALFSGALLFYNCKKLKQLMDSSRGREESGSIRTRHSLWAGRQQTGSKKAKKRKKAKKKRTVKGQKSGKTRV